MGSSWRWPGSSPAVSAPARLTGVLFVTLEDETGNVNLVVWASVFERFRAALLQGRLLQVKGVVERENKVIHVVAGRIEVRLRPAGGNCRRRTSVPVPGFQVGRSDLVRETSQLDVRELADALTTGAICCITGGERSQPPISSKYTNAGRLRR